MADTGSEVAEGSTRVATATVARILERHFMWQHREREHQRRQQQIRERQQRSQKENQRLRQERLRENDASRHDDGRARDARGAEAGETSPAAVVLTLTPPKEAFEERVTEVGDLFEREGIAHTLEADAEAGTIRLTVPEESAERATAALAALEADPASSHTKDEVEGPERVEACETDAWYEIPDEPASVFLTEASTLDFRNHPDTPDVDATHAHAFAETMRGCGFDAEAHDVPETDGDVRHVVAVTYPAEDRERFLEAAGVALDDAGALSCFADADIYEEHLDLTEEGRELHDEVPDVAREMTPEVPEALTAEAYLALPATKRARIAPERIPEQAFGHMRYESVASAMRTVARELEHVPEASRHPRVPMPDLGERR